MQKIREHFIFAQIRENLVFYSIIAIMYQCFEDFLLEGEGGSWKNDHEFPFLNNIELCKRSLRPIKIDLIFYIKNLD